MMECFYMDENLRPGAVISPKSVPGFTNQLIAYGKMMVDDCFFVHAETVDKIFRVTEHH